ncbi:MAG: class IV adenylate cyclase [Candidatus Promineifilaceae bacterium]|nr:class IV adenylate cyclase [Candidatus Promineifilaceae bacterium]
MSDRRRLEVEVKFYLADLDDFRERLLAAGARLKKARLFEHNVRYDWPDERLRSQQQLLRLRQDDRARLTFKGPASGDRRSEAKVREELEIEVGDFEVAHLLLERLGLEGQQTYEKYRETFTVDNVEVVLDELPFGNFTELEGEEEAIRALAAQLELDWEERIVENYLTLMARLQALYGLPFADLTFANFEGRDLSIAAVLGTGPS